MAREREKCPVCGRTAGQLVRKTGGTYGGYTLPGGGDLYSCGYDDCHVTIFAVYPDGAVTPSVQAVGAPTLAHILHHFHEALGEAHDLVDKATPHDEHDGPAMKRASELKRRGKAFLAHRIPQLRQDVDLLEAAIKREVGA